MTLDRRIEERLQYTEERVRRLQLQMQAEAEIRHRDRRERIAKAAMQAMLLDSYWRYDREYLSREAVAAADALIAELDKPKEVKP